MKIENLFVHNRRSFNALDLSFSFLFLLLPSRFFVFFFFFRQDIYTYIILRNGASRTVSEIVFFKRTYIYIYLYVYIYIFRGLTSREEGYCEFSFERSQGILDLIQTIVVR